VKFILINGPKRTGKTTLATLFANAYPDDVAVIGFSYHLKRFVHSIYLGETGWHFDPDHFDDCKERQQDILGGMSWRQAYIHYSENVIKPLHGKTWFGKQLLRIAMSTKKRIIAIPDSGFVEEAETLVRNVGTPNVVLLRLHRPGHGFEGDSRSYIDLAHVGVPSRDIYLPEGLNWLDLLQENMRDVMIYLGAVERDG
jgi:hypothetical protein